MPGTFGYVKSALRFWNDYLVLTRASRSQEVPKMHFFALF